jgi:hypothetical protein
MSDKKIGYIIYDDDQFIEKITTGWMNTDFIPGIDIIEKIDLVIDDEVINLGDLSKEENSIIIKENNCRISRLIKEHEVFPYPEIILKIINNDTKKHDIKLTWTLKSKESYALVNEKLSELYTDYKQEYLFFILIPSFLTRDETSISIHTLENSLYPNDSDEVHISLF